MIDTKKCFFPFLVQSRLSFPIDPIQDEETSTKILKEAQEASKDTSSLEDRMKDISLPDKKEVVNTDEKSINVVVPQADFMLGIAGMNDIRLSY